MILSNVNYVKKVIFPLEILPLISLGSAFFHALISLLVWFIAYLAIYGLPHLTAFFLPLIFLPLMLFILGISWGLASLGVYLRDVSQLVGILTTVFMFLSPIFYPLAIVPAAYRPLLYLNPLLPPIEMTRAVLFYGKNPDWILLGGYMLFAFITAWMGFAWFQKTRKGFADVL
jgi:lipopolysaccharide transport system permease protein